MSDQDQSETRSATGRRARIPSDVIVAMILLAFCAGAYAMTTQFRIVPPIISQGLQAAAFPQMVILLMAMLSALLAVLSIVAGGSKVLPSMPPVVFATTALGLGFALAIQYLGFIAAAVLLCIALPILWGERHFWAIGIFAIAFSGTIYLLFTTFLGVRLPRGVLAPLLGL